MQSFPSAPGLQTALMNDAQLQMNEFARALRSARTRQQLSVEDAAKACLLSDNQILGLEAADLRPFYSASYASRGAERYAKFLGVSPVPQTYAVLFSTVAPDNPRQPAQTARPRWTSRLKDWIDPLKLQRWRSPSQPER